MGGNRSSSLGASLTSHATSGIARSLSERQPPPSALWRRVEASPTEAAGVRRSAWKTLVAAGS